MTRPSIRKATSADIPTLQALASAFHTREIEPLIAVESIFHPHSPYYASVGKGYITQAVQDPSSLCLVAHCQQTPIGYLIGRMRDENVTEIEHLFLQEAHRRHRTGTRLIHAFIAWSNAQGVREIIVETFPLTKPVRFYLHLGFSPVSFLGRKFLIYTIPLS